jgi:hypothetical protein
MGPWATPGGPGGITSPQPLPLTNAEPSWGSMMTPGDMNLDGLGDLIVGARDFNMVGRTYLYYGSATGVSPDNPITTDGVDVDGHFGSPLGRHGKPQRRR